MFDINPNPTFVRWTELYRAMEPLHQGDKALVDSLHDIWRGGAPDPQSIVYDPVHFDERVDDPARGRVKRLIIVPRLAEWIQEASAKRGFPYSERQAYNLIYGEVDYGW